MIYPGTPQFSASYKTKRVSIDLKSLGVCRRALFSVLDQKCFFNDLDFDVILLTFTGDTGRKERECVRQQTSFQNYLEADWN